MNETADESHATRASRATSQARERIASVAQLAVQAASANGGTIAWHSPISDGIARVPAGSDQRAILDRLLSAAERRFEQAPSAKSIEFSAGEIAAITGASEKRLAAAAARAVGDDGYQAIAIIAGELRGGLAGAAELAAAQTIAILGADAAAASRAFWIRRASETGVRLSAAAGRHAAGAADRDRIERAVAAAMKFKPRNRFAGLGALFARFGPFDAWLVAVPEEGELRVTAASAALAPLPPLTDASAIADSIKRQTAIIRVTAGSHGAFQEDRLFGRCAAYMCLPMGDGGIALAARDPIADATVAQVEALAARLTPIVRLWMAEAETEQLRRLVRNLGLRMFGAVDTERARIARDLHDHQAQLLAAARIAIEAGPDEARGIFKQVEDALRLRVRELRPATLGRSTLADALRYELRRLSEAGIKGRLIHAERMKRVTRPVQQLCYQVAREALANVMRHSGASRVEVEIEKHRGRVRLIIQDNGHGVAAPSDNRATRAGMGLSGLGERLELMGGSYRIESQPGATRLIAEIPEPA